MAHLSQLALPAARTFFFLLLICVASAQAQSNSSSQDSAMSDRVKQLEAEVQELKAAIASMKTGASTAPAASTSEGAVPSSSLVSTGSTTATTETAKPTSIGSLLGPTSLSGFVDTYYLQNFNNPATRTNGYRSFDSTGNQFGLNLIELVIDKAPDAANSRTGYHIALGYGNAMTAIYASEPVPFSPDQYVKEAYFSYLAPLGKGLQVDIGKFVTPFGAEVIETKDNWNYSRGLLFSYAIPYYHFGMRAKYAFNDKYALTGFFTNGWNDVLDNNSAKTYGATFAWTPNKKFSVSENFMIGPEQTNNNSNWRQLWDTVATISPTKRLTFMANYDYGRGDRITGVASPVWWTGIAGYVKYALNDKNAIATRYEYYNDHYGFTTGTAGHVQEVTGTYEHILATHIMTRLEFRHDIANNPVFTKGTSTPVSSQTTMTAGMVFMFDTREGTK